MRKGNELAHPYSIPYEYIVDIYVLCVWRKSHYFNKHAHRTHTPNKHNKFVQCKLVGIYTVQFNEQLMVRIYWPVVLELSFGLDL